jgi:hypothetical protein
MASRVCLVAASLPPPTARHQTPDSARMVSTTLEPTPNTLHRQTKKLAKRQRVERQKRSRGFRLPQISLHTVFAQPCPQQSARTGGSVIRTSCGSGRCISLSNSGKQSASASTDPGIEAPNTRVSIGASMPATLGSLCWGYLGLKAGRLRRSGCSIAIASAAVLTSWNAAESRSRDCGFLTGEHAFYDSGHRAPR